MRRYLRSLQLLPNRAAARIQLRHGSASRCAGPDFPGAVWPSPENLETRESIGGPAALQRQKEYLIQNRILQNPAITASSAGVPAAPRVSRLKSRIRGYRERTVNRFVALLRHRKAACRAVSPVA
jgi:hypothetical protein